MLAISVCVMFSIVLMCSSARMVAWGAPKGLWREVPTQTTRTTSACAILKLLFSLGDSH